MCEEYVYREATGEWVYSGPADAEFIVCQAGFWYFCANGVQRKSFPGQVIRSSDIKPFNLMLGLRDGSLQAYSDKPSGAPLLQACETLRPMSRQW